MAEPCDTTERTEPKDGSNDEAKRYPDGTVEAIIADLEQEAKSAWKACEGVRWWQWRSRIETTSWFVARINALVRVKRIAKTKAATQEAGKPTSTPSG